MVTVTAISESALRCMITIANSQTLLQRDFKIISSFFLSLKGYFLIVQSTPANPDTEGTGQNRPDTAESGLAGVKCIESGLRGQKRLSGCRGNPD